jgi:hypothetical protein
MIIVFKPLTQKLARENWESVQLWFKNNPKRRVAWTDLGKIRKKFMKEDFLKFCKKGVKLD